MATEKQKRACIRNWDKARVTAMYYTVKNMQTQGVLTDWEKLKLIELQSALDTILTAWDESSKELGFKVRPRKEPES